MIPIEFHLSMGELVLQMECHLADAKRLLAMSVTGLDAPDRRVLLERVNAHTRLAEAYMRFYTMRENSTAMEFVEES